MNEADEKLLILLVEDDPAVAEVTRLLFEARGHEVIVANSLVEAVRRITEKSDRSMVALIDINLSRFTRQDGTVETLEEGSGLRLLEIIRDSASHHVVPFVYTGFSNPDYLLKAYQIGVAGDITKGVDPRILVAKVENEFTLKAARYSSIDNATDLLNFRVFQEIVLKDLSKARSSDPKGYSLIMFDMDDFKEKINDTYGHATGDRAIEAVGKSIRQALRKDDLCCRRSGDEFLVWLRGSSLDHALVDALRVKRMVALAPVVTDEGKIIHTSVSFGVSFVRREQIGSAAAALEKLMGDADKQLKTYKENMKIGR